MLSDSNDNPTPPPREHKEEEEEEGMRVKRDPFRALAHASLYGQGQDQAELSSPVAPRSEHKVLENDSDQDTITVGLLR